MSIIAILVAVVLAFLVFRFVAGMVKFLVIAAILAALAWYFFLGGAA